MIGEKRVFVGWKWRAHAKVRVHPASVPGWDLGMEDNFVMKLLKMTDFSYYQMKMCL